jgi:hypothetical protein
VTRLVLDRVTRIDAPLDKAFAFFSFHRNLQEITPPWARFRIAACPSDRLHEGDRIEYRFRVFGLPMRWTARITAYRENEIFADFQERGPFRYWLHTHSFRADGDATVMHDHVEYELPFGFVGRWFGARLVRKRLEAIFDYRAERLHRGTLTIRP